MIGALLRALYAAPFLLILLVVALVYWPVVLGVALAAVLLTGVGIWAQGRSTNRVIRERQAEYRRSRDLREVYPPL